MGRRTKGGGNASTAECRLAEVMRRTGCSNTSLASRVQAVAREQGADLKCTHVDVRRWLDGVMPRPATAQFIATALSRKAGTRISIDDIGLGGTTTSADLESGLEYPAEGTAAGQDAMAGQGTALSRTGPVALGLC